MFLQAVSGNSDVGCAVSDTFYCHFTEGNAQLGGSLCTAGLHTCTYRQLDVDGESTLHQISADTELVDEGVDALLTEYQDVVDALEELMANQ